ncbi:RelA/SpoT family protein [Butyrivibrio sp. MC2013]|uniref:RelA/SpoT family protein n=1 Tax=Butyrivibrio sp. MC2013 TaxID=1280686 RepID=UPI0003FA2AAB|nr:bifunctional (p)ppGpp synthetase/guanosine-3',5'-bis(diphosphate) 3'-pyrophosphohydrolase [Butyrivibrio sp. MC2013]
MIEQRFDDGKIESIKEFQAPEDLYRGLIERVRKYHPSDDITMIEKAYNIAHEAHKDQLRKSGEPYIIHPLCVGIILADLEMDKETIAAGLLHDVVEDTILTKSEIEDEFGEDVALLVDGVTKLQNLQLPEDYRNKPAEQLEMQAENLRKMFLAMARDIRVILIKLADRLHNMRTLAHMPSEKQHRIAQETLDIYSPIAGRLGISKIKVELDDLSLKYLKPEIYADLKAKVAQKKEERESYVESIAQGIEKAIADAGIKGEVNGRVKHFFSIYKKMHNQGKTLDQIYDLFAVRIIVESVKDCYAALGVIHEMYKPIPGRFKDYIAMPKANMYQSLHTTLIGTDGVPFEIQIRTYDMHRAAEYGIAAHWKYKEASDGKKIETQEEEKLVWLRQILEWQRDMSDNQEFMNLLKSDLNLFSDDVYCFTPQGDVKNLANGSTPIDFAYSIHSAVGNKMIGAKVNGKLVPIDYKIRNGDRVEIITSQNSKGPSRDWLSIARSTSTKNKINQWFRTQFKEENITKGRELIADYCKTKSIELSDIAKPEYMNIIVRKYGFHDWDAVLAAIGHGGLKEGGVVNKLVELYDRDHHKNLTDEEVLAAANESYGPVGVGGNWSGGAIIVKGVHDVAVRFSRCCNPVPGDDIVGFVTRGRGVSIHRSDCVNVTKMVAEDRSRLIEAKWESDSVLSGEKYAADIKIFANDRKGLLADVSRVLTENNISIISLNTRTSKQGLATMETSFQVSSREELITVTDKLRAIENVIDIERSTG